jgi:hypothetical protein
MIKLRKDLSYVVIGLVLLSMSLSTGLAAPTYTFINVTNNNVGDAAIGEAQLSVEILDEGSNQVQFLFSNSGPAASSITDVYFDDGSLLGIATILNEPGVSFSAVASPPNLPGANNASPPFVTTAGFSADSDPPVQPYGVNPGEQLGITFDLQNLRFYDDVLDELASGALRIGLHVQGFSSGGSESFVNNPSVVPTPSALLLGSIGFVLALRLRKNYI